MANNEEVEIIEIIANPDGSSSATDEDGHLIMDGSKDEILDVFMGGS